jgi:hypothetical protein
LEFIQPARLTGHPKSCNKPIWFLRAVADHIFAQLQQSKLSNELHSELLTLFVLMVPCDMIAGIWNEFLGTNHEG